MRESAVNNGRKLRENGQLMTLHLGAARATAGYPTSAGPAIIGRTMTEQPMISDVHFEQTAERLKIILPVRRKWPFLILYSILALAWVVMLIWGVVYLIQMLFSGQSYRFLFALMIVIFLLILFRFGKFLMRQWAQFLSNREIIFINREELIVRRPVSIWGNTDVYDMAHVTHFYQADSPKALAFDYGYRHIYVAEALTAEARQALLRHLNETYFPNHYEDED